MLSKLVDSIPINQLEVGRRGDGGKTLKTRQVAIAKWIFSAVVRY